MPDERTRRVINELRRFFNVSTKEDLVRELLTPAGGSSASAVNTTLLDKIASSIVSVADGGLTSADVVKALKEYDDTGSTVEKLVTIHAGNSSYAPASTSIDKIVGNEFVGSKLAAFNMKSVQLLPASRDVDAVTLFMNSIPTLELSRAVPYLNIEVQLSRSGENKRLQTMSLARFLEGSIDVPASTKDLNLLAAAGNEQPGGENVLSTAGMELFTSPQTLVNPDPSLDVNRATPAIDKFRPFMTIESYNAELQPHVGFFAYYRAKLNVILHDRSRLADIADLVRPDLYQGVELLVEYGWSHPGDNSFGELLNLMRNRQKMSVINASFSTTNTGQLRLALELATKGSADLYTVSIGDNPLTISAANTVRKLQRSISEKRSKIKQSKGKKMREIRGAQALFATSEDLSSSLTLTPAQSKQLNRFLSKKTTSSDVKDLQNALRDLYVGNDSAAEKLRKSLAAGINKKLDTIRDPSRRTPDPFLDVALRPDDSRFPKFVSLGKLLLLYVGLPLSASPSYEEVQMLFYPFNHAAGRARKINISNFAIEINELRQSLTALSVSRRGNNVQLREFVQFVFNNFVDDMASINYGLQNIYHTQIDPKTGTRISKKNKSGSQKRLNEQEDLLKKIGIPDGRFKMPKLDVIVESVPSFAFREGERQVIAKDKTILRIHVFDSTATRYESLGDLLRLSRVDNLGTAGVNKSESADDSEHTKLYNKFLDQMVKSNIIRMKRTKDGSKGVYELIGDVTAVKRFVSDNTPTLVYGSNNTGIKNASFATIQDPLLSTVHMRRAGKQNAVTPEGLSQGNLPLVVLPSRATVTAFGCPLLGYMQQFFVDFQTNTTADNLYGVTNVNHELSHGKFETRFDLVPNDSYAEFLTLQQAAGAAVTELEVSEE